MIYDVVIIGAGVIGGMIARELSRYQLSVCLLEKENDVACGASKANSGIIHGGFDPEPGTLKAKLNAAGVPLLYEAARELHVPYRNNGSLVCAFSSEEDAGLETLLQRGIENGIDDLSIISGEEARKLEPELSKAVTKALHVPNAGIVCPYALTIGAVGNAMDNGVALRRNFQVTSIEATAPITVRSQSGEIVQGIWVVNCAGAYADKIAQAAGDRFFRITPRSGEYLLLDKAEGSRVSHTIFRLPSKAGKGILVTPTADGNLLVGPTAEAIDDPACTDTTPEGLARVLREARENVPSIDFRQIVTSFSGVRASEGHGDFIIRPSQSLPGLIHAAAIDSPGLTCSVSIAKYVIELLQQGGMILKRKEHWDGNRPDPHFFQKMTHSEQNAWITQHPEYGSIVCRCETVSEGEIRAVIRQNPPAWDVDGVKRRTRSGMGRCQGGFCGPTVLRLLSEELGIPMEQITKNGVGSEMLVGRIGETDENV